MIWFWGRWWDYKMRTDYFLYIFCKLGRLLLRPAILWVSNDTVCDCFVRPEDGQPSKMHHTLSVVNMSCWNQDVTTFANFLCPEILHTFPYNSVKQPVIRGVSLALWCIYIPYCRRLCCQTSLTVIVVKARKTNYYFSLWWFAHTDPQLT